MPYIGFLLYNSRVLLDVQYIVVSNPFENTEIGLSLSSFNLLYIFWCDSIPRLKNILVSLNIGKLTELHWFNTFYISISFLISCRIIRSSWSWLKSWVLLQDWYNVILTVEVLNINILRQRASTQCCLFITFW